MTASKALTFAVAGLLVALGLAAVAWLKAGGYDQWRSKRTIGALVNAQAAREQVIAQLKVPFIDYSVGATSRGDFEQWLTRSSDSCRTGVRERALRYPGVLYHTTAWTMTWLFFDESGKLRAQFTCTQ